MLSPNLFMKTQRNLWPYGLCTAFGLFFCGMATVVVIAETHRETLVSDDYYEQEIGFQSQLDAGARARTCGATLNYDASAGRVLVSLPARQVSQAFSGRAGFYRASSSALDRELALAPGSDGTQSLSVANLAPGPWKLRVNWQAAGTNYFLEQTLVVPAR